MENVYRTLLKSLGTGGLDKDPYDKTLCYAARCIRGGKSTRSWVCLGLDLVLARISPFLLKRARMGLSPIFGCVLPAVPGSVAVMLCAAGGTQPAFPTAAPWDLLPCQAEHALLINKN